MNELERLIAEVTQPEPSEKLDQRIDALLAHQPVRAPLRRWNGTISWIAAAACVGVLGFILGRRSVVVGHIPSAVAAVAPGSHPPPEAAPVAAHVTNIPLKEDQLAGLLAPGSA